LKPKRIFSHSLVVVLIFSVFVPNANAENVELTVKAEYKKYLDADPVSQLLRGINYLPCL
jgi:hypothetical protein